MHTKAEERPNQRYRRLYRLPVPQPFGLHDGMLERKWTHILLAASSYAMRAARETQHPAVVRARATRQPVNPSLVAKQHRPRGYWKHRYIEKQESHPGKVVEHEQALEAAQRNAAGRAPKPYVGRSLATLNPPPAPSLFQRDWLRSLLCEGCGLPATTNTTKCLHCNVVVHNWCRDLTPAGARPKRPARSSSVAPQQQQQAKLTTQKTFKNNVEWVCWECQEDMVLDLQYYRRLKNRQKGANVEKRAAGKIIRFIAWVADCNNALKAERRAIRIQSLIRMRVVYVRFRVWSEAQKRAMTVSVRGASGLPYGDPISRKCQPYIILTVVENSKDDPSHPVETISHRLQTKKGGDKAGPSITPTASAATAHSQSHHHPAPGHQSSHGGTPHGGGAARKHPAGQKEKTSSFQWDEEFLLPGVSDSATIVFTVLHQTPTKAVCLGQALVDPKQFSRNEEHVRTVTLAKQQVTVPSGPRFRVEEARMINADWAKAGNLTFTIKKSSYCDAHCSEVNGPIAEEINTLALAESQEERRRVTSGSGAAAANAHKDPHTAATTPTAGKSKRDSSGGKSKLQHSGGSEPAHDTPTTPQAPAPPPGALSHSYTTNRVHIKAGDLSTVWWACVWQGYLRVYRYIGDAQPKVTLPLDRWSLAPLAEAGGDGDNTKGKTAARDLRLFCAFPKRWLALRCATIAEKQRWEEVITKNQGGSCTQRKPRASMLDQTAAH